MKATFIGGPAADVTMSFERAPIWLRVAHNPDRAERNGFDALDQLDDTPEEGESISVYRQIAYGNVCARGDDAADSGPVATYEYVEVSDVDDLRDTEAWQRFARSAWEASHV